MAGVEFTRFVVDIGTRMLVSGAIGWMCFNVGLYYWDELSRRHLVRRRSRELRDRRQHTVNPTKQAQRWWLDDDLFAYRCHCGNLWFGDEQVAYCMGEVCPKCIPENKQKETDEVDRLEQIQEEEFQAEYERSQLQERRRHAEEQGEYLQLASRED